MTTFKIEKKITDYKVKDSSTPEAAPEPVAADANIEHMHENVGRPELLMGATYKVKTPLSDHALYITINDIVLNPDTDHELRRPFEIFINSKNMEQFQWVVALTRVISAVFRKGGDVTFLAEELQAVFDPKGGYFKKGGRFVPSLVAEIGDAIETHLKTIGLLQTDELTETQKQVMAEKRAQYEASESAKKPEGDGDFPAGAQLCNKCNTKAAILMDGCMTCLNCGNSKCG